MADQRLELRATPDLKALMRTHEMKVFIDYLAAHIGSSRVDLTSAAANAELGEIRYRAGIIHGIERVHKIMWDLARSPQP